MSRWLTASVFIAGGIYVRHYNEAHQGSQFTFPGMEFLVGADIYAQGELTWQIIIGLGVLFLLGAAWFTIRGRISQG